MLFAKLIKWGLSNEREKEKESIKDSKGNRKSKSEEN